MSAEKIGPRIILLNGVGSAGKSSIAKALQAIASRPFLHVQMDSFLDMLPAALENHPDTFTYRQVTAETGTEVVIATGPLGDQVLRGMRCAVRAMAEQGLNLIVDDVLMGRDDPGVREYRDLLSAFAVDMVGVFARLETLEERERQRGDRLIGLARWQYERVHNAMSYDLEVHTDDHSPAIIAEQIRQSLGL
ncbi:MAG: chloramphenicol phosphotransferase CPT family protein [Devosia sp.]